MSQLQFLWPFVFLLLPLPFILRRLLTPHDKDEQAIWMPVIDRYQSLEEASFAVKRVLPMIFWSLCWFLLVFACARPVWITEYPGLPVSGRDLIIAVDLSESMHQTDFELGGQQVNRLVAAQAVAGEFIDKRVGDRIGLVVFGNQAYFYTPMTHDRQTVQILLQETTIGLAGSKTAIGDAIGLVVKHLNESRAEQRILILMTDGANTAGDIPPDVAARMAAKYGLKIYTIGIGEGESPSTDEEFELDFGSNGLDEGMLREIAQITGGIYFRASDTRQLGAIYAEIDQLEPVKNIGETLFETKSLFFYPLIVCFALLFLAQFIERWKRGWRQ